MGILKTHKSFDDARIRKFPILFWFLLVFGFICVFNGLGSAPFLSQFSVRPHHIAGLVICVFLILKPTITLPPISIFLFCGVSIITTLINLQAWGVDNLIFSYLWGAVAVLAVMNCYSQLPREFREKLMVLLAIAVWAVVICKWIAQADTYVDFFQHRQTAKPRMLYFSAGGLNLEATWLSLLGLFLLKYPLFQGIYLGTSLFISVTYMSRVGMVACVCVLVWSMIHSKRKLALALTFGTSLTASFAAFVLLTWLLSVLNNAVGLTPVTQIFEETGHRITADARGIRSRFDIWEASWEAFKRQWWGYGSGNAMKAVQAIENMQAVPTLYTENNVHNLYLQVLLDGGIIGLAIFVFMCVRLVANNIKSLAKNPYAAFLLLYCAIALLQFKGADAPMVFVLGMYLVQDEGNTRKLITFKNPFSSIHAIKSA